VRGRAPLAAKTDKIDARVLAELTRRALVSEIWLPTPEVRQERERARFRLHLVRHRSALKNRVAATLMTFGHPRPMADLFGVGQVAKAAAEGTWTAAAWWLERRKHQDYGRRERVDMTIDLRREAERLAAANGLDPEPS
jgi:Transposase